MARVRGVTTKLFMDASYAVALGSPRDQYHASALVLSRRMKAERIRVVTTRAVIIEVGNALSKPSFRSTALALLNSFDQDPLVEVTPLSEELYERGAALFRRHQDKDWGLTDCISFVVMKERGLTDALTADAHFRQAGYRPLLSS
jgi:predicted nucleic acid-binding protein